MRYLGPYLRKCFPFIVCASVALNILFITSNVDNVKWNESLTPAPSIVWPSQIGSFRVLFNYASAEIKYNYTESVTFSTQATPDFLYHLVELSKRWQGPVSIAVFTPGSDFNLAVKVIQFLRDCTGESVRNYVTFHLFFKQEKASNIYPFPSYSKKSDSPVNCSWDITKLSRKTFRNAKNVTYPVNAARNIARVLANTLYILTCDLELYPSVNFISQFLKMLERQRTVAAPSRVYVLPVFEVEKGEATPRTKMELVELFRKNKAVSFHRYLCRKCHQIPDEPRWINSTCNGTLDVFSVVQRSPTWEPIFVGTNNDPLYDERLSWEGMADKMSQMYEMCLMKYQLHILDEAFLTHAPGIKRNAKQNLNWRKSHIQYQIKIKRQIKAEIDARHPDRPVCTF